MIGAFDVNANLLRGDSELTYRIIVDDLNGPDIAAMIAAHKALMLEHSPPESSHALLLDGLRTPDITMWTLWQADTLMACGALKRLSDSSGEVKSMHTAAKARGQGFGRVMLDHIMAEAKTANITDLWLETGSMDGFKPARKLYESAGFGYCGPFADYVEDPNSVFMHLRLA